MNKKKVKKFQDERGTEIQHTWDKNVSMKGWS